VDLPDNFVRCEQGGVTIWIDRNLADQTLLGVLADADRLFTLPTCQIVKDQKKIKVARIHLSILGNERAVYVKRYNSFSSRFKLLSLLFKSGALRSLQGAALLERARIGATSPVAAIERRRCGSLLGSFFISDEIAGGKTADAYWIETLRQQNGADGFRRRREFIQQLARLFRVLHVEGIYHNDLKDANILVVDKGAGGCELFLLDLEGVRRCQRLGNQRRLKNLVQLYRTLGKHLSRPQQLFFLRVYLGASFVDRRSKRQWIVRLLRRAHQIDLAKRRKGVGAAF